MDNYKLALFWHELPTGRNNAVCYEKLCALWGVGERAARQILHELSAFDNGDDYVLIRSSKGKGFYKTDDKDEIEAYKKECLHKGKSIFAPVRKINRILNANDAQYSFENNLRVMREGLHMKQSEVCEAMRNYFNDAAFDVPMLSKMENGFCLPTPTQLYALAEIYMCAPQDLIDFEGFNYG